MNDHIFAPPTRYTAARLTVDDRNDDFIKEMFAEEEYIAGYEVLVKEGRENKHYHIMIAKALTAATRQRISRYAKGRAGADTWTKTNYKTFEGGVSYTIKDGEWFASTDRIEAYAKTVKEWVHRSPDDAGPPKDPTDRKKMAWLLNERNVERLYHAHKHNVDPNSAGVYDFVDVVQWICRNTNWRLSRSFLSNVTRALVRCCETNDNGEPETFERLRRSILHSHC